METHPYWLIFMLTGAAPSKLMGPILKDLKKKTGDTVNIIKIDAEKNADAAIRYNVRGVPTLILFHQGKVLWQQSGVVQADQLHSIIKQKIEELRKKLPYSYNVDLNWKEGRIGTLISSNLNQSVEVATPPEFKNGVEGIWSPEHLLVASVSSCFMTTFLAIAENSGLDYVTLDVNAVGLLDKKVGKFMITEIKLELVLVILDEKYGEKALRIMHKSEAACLITNSLKTKITFTPRVQIGEEAGRDVHA